MLAFISTLLIGITVGAIYSLMALSLVLVWRSTRVINFAQAGQAIFSTYVAYEVIQRTGNFILGMAAAVVVGALLGALVEVLLMRTLFKRIHSGAVAAVAPVIATLGLLGVIRASVGLIWGNDGHRFDAPVSTQAFSMGNTVIPFSRFNLLVIATAALVMIVFTVIFQKTSLGLSLRASAFAPEIARLSGIRVGSIRTIGWAFAGATGAVAGVLISPNDSLTPNSLDLLLIFGFVSAVIGGLDSLIGAVVGGLVLGIGKALILAYLGSSLDYPTAFVVLAIVLIVRPGGIFSMKRGRNA
ncbi:MAG: amino acid ABC transporter permease [Actinobacteria bacterium]|uniref:Unannotated protein n=1 Tax=freshwater metagenome TaxID=449393 RepID=A0A6J7HVH5_9ZZZZ|nr:amino acid ABC transporter permease [Actinomycetota bacterium]MSX24847.1 amino acid ABC transporter permease [Actinomycetota bacterium]MSY45818.1 amino acid ABC transporter permease [Actinomycetota bacterium]MSY57174.1 amino acid ABC transporter permease [Actinomycetota bacterium]MTB00582.1 amino acid ABC transporter permease [Actinomycetota bacterium]